MGQEENLRRVSELATQAADAVAQDSAAGLALLLAELKALSAMMPGMQSCVEDDIDCKEAEERLREREAEANFDNMPV